MSRLRNVQRDPCDGGVHVCCLYIYVCTHEYILLVMHVYVLSHPYISHKEQDHTASALAPAPAPMVVVAVAGQAALI